MAKKEIEKKNIDVKFEGLGTFQESTGGGTPIPKGETLAEHPEAHRVQQPRDENGQFTYNAANRKNLKYGPSRGKTIPPYLRIKDSYIKEKEGSKVVRKDNIYNVSVKLSGYTVSDLVNDCKEYIGNEGFKYKTELGEVAYAKKPGKKSAAEKAAILSDYKDDINKVKFVGSFEDKKALNQAYENYKQSGAKASFSFLLKKEDSAKPAPKPAPQPSPQPVNTPKKSQNFNEEDKNMAKNNAEGFKQKYAKEFNEIKSLLDSKGYDLDENLILEAISSGELSDFDEIKKTIEEIED